MPEPAIPLPPPERNPYWDPKPARCSAAGCRTILQNLHPASRKDGAWEGYCPEHGTVEAHYETRKFE